MPNSRPAMSQGFSFSSGNDTCLKEAGTCNKSLMIHICKTPICKYVNMFVSQVTHSGITLEPRVNQLVVTTVTLADSNMMTQLCRHNLEVKNLQQCA
jgi:hypothetical protein